MKNLLLTALLLASAALAHAAPAPTLIPFQGRLTDQAGNIYTNGQYTLIFTLYDQAVGGNVLWTETHQKVGVINGTVNVFLGSINAALASVDFSQTRHLGITIDADNNPNTPDPEMVPRQMIIPAFWAKKADLAATATDSTKLGGFDWTPLFGVNNPSGTIQGSKLAPGSLSGATLMTGTVPGSALALNSVGAGHLTASAVNTTNIANGSITQEKLAAANWAISANNSIEPTSYPADLLVSVTITTTGRPVFVGLTSGNASTLTGPGASYVYASSAAFYPRVDILEQNSQSTVTEIGKYALGAGINVPVSSVWVVYQPVAGTYTYKVRLNSVQGNGAASGIINARIIAYEL